MKVVSARHALEAMELLGVPGVMHRVLLCMLEAMEGWAQFAGSAGDAAVRPSTYGQTLDVFSSDYCLYGGSARSRDVVLHENPRARPGV